VRRLSAKEPRSGCCCSSGARDEAAATRALPPAARIVYNGRGLAQLIELSKKSSSGRTSGPIQAQFLDDMRGHGVRATPTHRDPGQGKLPRRLWMRKKPALHCGWDGRRQDRRRFKFWGGLTLEAIGGGPGGRVADADREEERRRDLVPARAVSLIADDAGVHGVV